MKIDQNLHIKVLLFFSGKLQQGTQSFLLFEQFLTTQWKHRSNDQLAAALQQQKYKVEISSQHQINSITQTADRITYQQLNYLSRLCMHELVS